MTDISLLFAALAGRQRRLRDETMDKARNAYGDKRFLVYAARRFNHLALENMARARGYLRSVERVDVGVAVAREISPTALGEAG